jgi:hypothetical protein
VGPVPFDEGVDVTVQVGDVEQFLEVVRGYLRLGFQGVIRGLRLSRRRGFHLVAH